MRIAPWLTGALLLAGCGQTESQQNGMAAGSAPTAAAPSPPEVSNAAPRSQIGTVSSLSGTQSNLTGAVTGFEVRQTSTTTVATLAADTLFAFDSSEIADTAAENLRRAADLIRKGADGTVRIVGHSDAKGRDSYNDDLSRRRAQAVADRLKGEIAPATRSFAVEGRGKRDPILPNTLPDGSDNPEGRARNRRVEVIIPR